jgi:hypothetical protein
MRNKLSPPLLKYTTRVAAITSGKSIFIPIAIGGEVAAILKA